ncbi:MAG: peroxiredoxin family protein [Pseudomonadales bacterium]
MNTARVRLAFFAVLISSLSLLYSTALRAERAPDFNLFDTQGEVVRLSDYRGKAVIVHFWGTWCPFCRQLQPGLERLYRKYKDSGLEVIAISIREPKAADPALELEKLEITFKTALRGEKVAKIYQVPGTPTTFFIDRAGDIVWRTHIADADDPKLEQYTRRILSLD